jgi:hypothetical protein
MCGCWPKGSTCAPGRSSGRIPPPWTGRTGRLLPSGRRMPSGCRWWATSMAGTAGDTRCAGGWNAACGKSSFRTWRPGRYTSSRSSTPTDSTCSRQTLTRVAARGRPATPLWSAASPRRRSAPLPTGPVAMQRRSRSTRCMRAPGADPQAWCPTWPTWASPTSSCCPCPSTRSTPRGATSPPACTHPPRATADRRASGASWPPCTPPG